MSGFLRGWARLFGRKVGVDFGTASTVVCVPERGVVVREPTVAAVEAADGSVVGRGEAVGRLAEVMRGRLAERARVVSPLRDGTITDVALAGQVLGRFLAKATGTGWAGRPRLLMAVPGSATAVQRQAMIAAAQRAGAGRVWLIDRPKVAALGDGLNLRDPAATMLCDLGAGLTEVAVLSMGELTGCEAIRVAGNHLDRAIVNHVRRRFGLGIGLRAAEALKRAVGSAAPLEQQLRAEVCGRDVATGLPRRVELHSGDVHQALAKPLEMIIETVESLLADCRPEVAADLMRNGLVLTGGTALLRGLEQRMSHDLGMPVRVAEEPLGCVARGLLLCLEQPALWHHLGTRHQAA